MPKKNANNIKAENITLELGEKLDKDINNYIRNENIKDCKLDLSKVKSEKVGKYDYYVICEKKIYNGIIEVKDRTSPKISLQVVNIKIGETINPNQFIMASYDLSKINYSFSNNFDINNYNTKNGLYLIPIKAIDEYNNETEETGILLVSNALAIKYLSASKIESTNYNATLKVTDKIGFNQSNYFVNAIRIYEYTFNSVSEYKEIKEGYRNNGIIDNIIGETIFDDNKLNIKIIKILSKEELNLLSGLFPFTYNDIQMLYSSLGYTSTLEIKK